ncbi:Hypothetical protein, putative [Bodo saltans]|uniref:Uncharacterized protein n=1 Tax=Bodo saltans TaxID=75058 RepID=A0A0S4IVN3_BODSA|nr:Hypothetical protein, putative [Bodo saltans]|eukprot:CUF58106.1 Hypothetical protein, putative [Bodo saltans]
MPRNDNDVSLLTWGPLPPHLTSSVDAPYRQQKYILLRQQFSTPKAFLEMPTPHHKILCGGVVVHGRTVVLSSFPDDGTFDGEAADAEHQQVPTAAQRRVQRWVVHHRPMTTAARIEAIVVAVFDPDDLLDVQINMTSWGQVRRMAKQTSSSSSSVDLSSHLYRWDLEEQHQHARAAGRRSSVQQITSLLVAQVNCAKVEEESIRSNSGGHGQSVAAAHYPNAWMLVGGGFHSEHPVVSCGPEWRRVWRVAAPPHDALAAFSISIRMSTAFLESKHFQLLWSQRQQQQQHNPRARREMSPIRHHYHSTSAEHNDNDDDDDDEDSIRFESAVQSCAPSGPPSPLNVTRRMAQPPAAAGAGNGVVDLTAVAAALVDHHRSHSTTSSIDFDERTDDTLDGRGIIANPQPRAHVATPSLSSSRIRSSTSSPPGRHPQSIHHPQLPLIRVSLGDTVRSTTSLLAASRSGGAGVDRSEGCGGEWSVTLQ